MSSISTDITVLGTSPFSLYATWHMNNLNSRQSFKVSWMYLLWSFLFQNLFSVLLFLFLLNSTMWWMAQSVASGTKCHLASYETHLELFIWHCYNSSTSLEMSMGIQNKWQTHMDTHFLSWNMCVQTIYHFPCYVQVLCTANSHNLY